MFDSKDSLKEVFCTTFSREIPQRWATCYKCNKPVRVTSNIPQGDVKALAKTTAITSVSSKDPLGICLILTTRIDQQIVISKFDQQKHIVLCIECLDDRFLSTNDSLFRRCPKCFQFFDDSDADELYTVWAGCYNLGSDYEEHILECQQDSAGQIKGTTVFRGNLLPVVHSSRKIKLPPPIKAFLIRKNDIE